MKKGFVHIFLIFIIALVGIGAIGYLAYKQDFRHNVNTGPITITPLPTPTGKSNPTISNAEKTYDESGYKTYVHSKYGFKFKYPRDYKIDLDNDLAILLTKNNSKTITIAFYSPSEIKYVTDYDNTFLSFASFEAMQECASNGAGPNGGETYCNKINKSETYQTSLRYPVYKLYPNLVSIKYNNASKSEKVVGPIYFIDSNSLTQNQLKGIAVLYSPFDSVDNDDIMIIQKIVESVETIK